MVKFRTDPKRTALFNGDLQNVLVEGYPVSAPGGLQIVERVNRLGRFCRRHGAMVVHTAHVTRANGSNVGVIGEIIPPVRDLMIAQGSRAAALHPKLEVEPSDIRIEKPRFGAFHATDV